MLLEELHAFDSHVPTFWRWLEALLPHSVFGPENLGKYTPESKAGPSPPTRQELLERLVQVDISTEPDHPRPQPKPISIQAGIAAAANAKVTLDQSLLARAAQIQSLKAAQARRAGGVEGVGSNIPGEALSAADAAVRAELPDLSFLLETVIAELELGRPDTTAGMDSWVEEDAVAQEHGYRYQPSGLVRLAHWPDDEGEGKGVHAQQQQRLVQSSEVRASTVREESDAAAEKLRAVTVADAAMETARLVRRRFVPHVKPEAAVKGGTSPYASASSSSTSTKTTSSHVAPSDQSNGSSSDSRASRISRGRGRSVDKVTGKNRERAQVISHQQWTLERENARLHRLLPGSNSGARKRAVEARAAAAERSAAVQDNLVTKITAAEAASAGCAQRVEVLRESHLAKLRAVWDEFLAARPESGYVALE